MLFQIPRQGHYRSKHGQRGGLAPQDAGAKAHRSGTGLCGHLGFLGGKAALGTGDEGDLQPLAVGRLCVCQRPERLLDVLGLVLPVALMGLGVVLFARGMGLALGAFGAWLALLQPGMTCQGGKHDVKYSYYHM